MTGLLSPEKKPQSGIEQRSNPAPRNLSALCRHSGVRHFLIELTGSNSDARVNPESHSIGALANEGEIARADVVHFGKHEFKTLRTARVGTDTNFQPVELIRVQELNSMLDTMMPTGFTAMLESEHGELGERYIIVHNEQSLRAKLIMVENCFDRVTGIIHTGGRTNQRHIVIIDFDDGDIGMKRFHMTESGFPCQSAHYIKTGVVPCVFKLRSGITQTDDNVFDSHSHSPFRTNFTDLLFAVFGAPDDDRQESAGGNMQEADSGDGFEAQRK